jgi:ArsR family transcriptional regulator, arsenate/arsenite/antimonite-responsive transcriptional repressor
VQDSQATPKETVRVLAALSDENRFRIVSLLAGEAGEAGELSCGAISKALSLSPSLLSHHLSILAEAGIIGRRKNGLWTMNALERPVIERQLAALESLIGGNGHRTNGDGPAVDAAPTGDQDAAPSVDAAPTGDQTRIPAS